MPPEVTSVIALGIQGLIVILTVWKIVNARITALKQEIDKTLAGYAKMGECIIKHNDIDRTFARLNGSLDRHSTTQGELAKQLAALAVEIAKMGNK
jgi:hypothetical protein